MIPLGKPLQQVLGIAALLLLGLGCALVLLPFLPSILWAAVICFSTWPVYRQCERVAAGRRALAAAMMTILVAVVLIAPFAVIGSTLKDGIGALLQAADKVLAQGPPGPPGWVVGIPLVGGDLATYWASLAHDAPAFTVELKRLIGPATNLVVASGAVLASGLLELGLSVFIAFFFFLHGRQMATYVRRIGERFAGTRAKELLVVVGTTVKGVIYGIIGTALAQGILAGIGFWIAGVSQALVLGFLTFALAFVPIGPPLVWGAVTLWLLLQGSIWWSIFIAVWGLILVSGVDNLIRPYFLGKANNLPVLLGLFGLVGGLLAFGFIGLFLGPTMLAVAYTLFLEWIRAELEERRSPTTKSGHE